MLLVPVMTESVCMSQLFPLNSLQAFQKLPDYTLLPTACSEASKLGASLSSLCLLVNRKHTYFWRRSNTRCLFGGLWIAAYPSKLWIYCLKKQMHAICETAAPPTGDFMEPLSWAVASLFKLWKLYSFLPTTVTNLTAGPTLYTDSNSSVLFVFGINETTRLVKIIFLYFLV